MIQMLLSLPASIKVGSAFAAILVLYRAGVPLGPSIAIAALALTLWGGAGVEGLRYEAEEIVAVENLLLVSVILLLLFFSNSLGVSGRIERSIAALRARLQSTRLLLGGLPALIGLLPMPGGALFSAPAVASLDGRNSIHPVRKVAINYWFRHIWEYWWPLYPGVVLAMKYSGLPLWFFLLIHIPFSAVAAGAGYFFILREVEEGETKDRATAMNFRSLWQTLGPIALLVGVSVGGSTVLTLLGYPRTLANLVAMLGGLAVALVRVLAGDRENTIASLRMFTQGKTWSLILLIVGVQAFSAGLKCPLDAEGATLVSRMRDELMALGIPLVIVKMVIPFVSGTVTGVSVGFVGASFPLVFALLGPDPALNQIASTTTFAYGFGFMGMMLSPVHICFLVTNEYFKTRLLHAYRYLWGPAVVILIASLGLAGVYYLVF